MSYFDKTVVLVEPDFQKVSLYRSMISRMEGFEVLDVFSDGRDAINKIGRIRPNLALISFYSDNEESLEVIDSLVKYNPKIDIILLVDFIYRDWIMTAMEYGASSFILKSQKLSEIENALKIAASGGSYLPPQIVRMLLTSGQKNISTVLTNREMQVMDLISEGKSYSRIARELGISNDTSRSHIKNIYAKLKVSTKADAIRKARSQRII